MLPWEDRQALCSDHISVLAQPHRAVCFPQTCSHPLFKPKFHLLWNHIWMLSRLIPNILSDFSIAKALPCLLSYHLYFALTYNMESEALSTVPSTWWTLHQYLWVNNEGINVSINTTFKWQDKDQISYKKQNWDFRFQILFPMALLPESLSQTSSPFIMEGCKQRLSEHSPVISKTGLKCQADSELKDF